jgi:hypothetical protein
MNYDFGFFFNESFVQNFASFSVKIGYKISKNVVSRYSVLFLSVPIDKVANGPEKKYLSQRE